MRVLGFAEYHPKLRLHTFTTFRYPRSDRDWEHLEFVQIVLKPRTKDRVPIGIAKISAKIEGYVFPQEKPFIDFPCHLIRPSEALCDGFSNLREMHDYFVDMHGKRLLEEPLNKLVLSYIERF